VDRQYDVIVVGAGPAGSATAYHLAARSRQVLLLEASRFPRDKSCGDALTARAMRLLTEMGVLASLPRTNRIRGARVHMRGHGSRDFEYAGGGDEPCGLIVPRKILDEAICARAVTAGAELWEGARVTAPVIERERVVGVRLRHAGRPLEVRAPVVVAADGARSRLARAAGLLPPGTPELGVATRGYLSGVDGLADLQEIFLPLMDVTERILLPSYGWIHPTGGNQANIGVGVFEPCSPDRMQELVQAFLTWLRAEHPGLRSSRLTGGWKAAPVRFDFSPRRCAGSGILLVGDAAGLVSPFTGEGISYALESAKTAAEVIDRSVGSSRTSVDLQDYSILLESRYSGYFETGHRSAHRYKLVWRVLESTFDSERPPFALCRRAVLLPEGAGELKASRYVDDVHALIAPGLNVRTDVLAVGEVMTTAVRDEWPFLARLAMSSWGDPGVPFRPTLFLLLASYLGDPGRKCLIDVAAAVELGCLAALAQRGVEEAPAVRAAPRPGQPPSAHSSWGNKFAILVGDLLLAKALQLAAQGGTVALELLSSAITTACSGQLRENRHAFDLDLSEVAHLRIIRMKTATLFELPCRLGGLLSGADASFVEALCAYARDLAIAYQLTDDLLDVTEDADGFGKRPGQRLREGSFSHSVLVAARRDPDGKLCRLLRGTALTAESATEALALVRDSGALAITRELARRHADRAAQALAALPAGPARSSLLALTDYSITRTALARPELLAVLDQLQGDHR
jgi:geranylgeranyl reductase family protein